MKAVTIDGENLYPLNDLKNFNKIFKKDVTYNDIKNTKIQGFNVGRNQIDPPPLSLLKVNAFKFYLKNR